MLRTSVLLLAGPTASGKTALALELAERLAGEIVNADSMQIYRELPILSARPTPQEEARIPHHLFGVRALTEAGSAMAWAQHAMPIIEDIVARDRVALVVGGTGLYFRTLLQGMAHIPDIPEDVRSAVRQNLKVDGAKALHQQLAQLDPEMAARLRPTDSQRLQRALEVILATGRSLADWQRQTAEGPLAPLDREGRVSKFVLMPPRNWIYQRCDARFEEMLLAGALEEVRAVAHLSPDLPGMKALGLPHLLAHLRGDMSLEQAVDKAKTATRHYAKRQMTWFRHQFPLWHWLEEKFMERNIEKMGHFISIK